MEFNDEMTYQTALATKTPDRAVSAPAIDTSATDDATDLRSDALKRLRDEASERLITALDNIDRQQVRTLRTQIRDLDELIQIAEVSELRERLNAIEVELKTNAESRDLIRQVIVLRKSELQEKLDELKPYQERLNKVAWEMSFKENDEELLRMERREKRAKLAELSEALRGEID